MFLKHLSSDFMLMYVTFSCWYHCQCLWYFCRCMHWLLPVHFSHPNTRLWYSLVASFCISPVINVAVFILCTLAVLCVSLCEISVDYIYCCLSFHHCHICILHIFSEVCQWILLITSNKHMSTLWITLLYAHCSCILEYLSQDRFEHVLSSTVFKALSSLMLCRTAFILT